MQKHILRSFALTSLVALAPLNSASADYSHWKDIGWWSIDAYSSSGGCSAMASFDGGITFFIGVDTTNNSNHLSILLLNSAWGSIEAGKEYSVSVAFGDEEPWSIDMMGFEGESANGLQRYIALDSDQADLFAEEFMRELDMNWRFEGRSLGLLSLKDSRKALQETLACTVSFLDATSGADPFLSSDQSDPFR